MEIFNGFLELWKLFLNQVLVVIKLSYFSVFGCPDLQTRASKNYTMDDVLREAE